MSLQPDDKSPKAPTTAPRRWLRAAIVAVLAVVFVGAAIGFVGFLSQLRGAEIRPDRNADGIVVLTGGSSRVSDAMELLAGGYGKRLLISGVHPTNAASDISRSLPDNSPPDNQTLAELLRRSRSLRRQHPQQRGGDAALGARARLQVADRGDIELPHAAGHRRTVARDARYCADSVRGGRRQMARRTVVDQWRDLAAAAVGICQIRRRRGAGAAGRCRSRTGARGRGAAATGSHHAAQTGDGSSQLIGFSMVSIFLRSLVYNVLFYLVLAFWVIVGIPTYLMPRWAIMAYRQDIGRAAASG